MAGQQAMHGRRRQWQVGGHLGAPACLADYQLHREPWVGLFGREQRLDYRRRQGPGLAAIGPRLWQQGLEATAPISFEPIAEGLGGDSSACAAGNGVVACGLLRDPVVEPRFFFGPLHEFGNHPVAKEGDLLTALCITVGHGGLLRSTQAVCLPGTRYAVAPGGSGPVSCWKRLRAHGVGRGRGRNPSGAGNTCSSAAAVPRKVTNTVAAAGGVPNAVSVGASAANGSGNSPRSSDNAAWTADTRRRTQRNAPGNSMSRRSVSHSTSRLGADSAARTTASTSAKVPESRAARQSGSRLNVRCPAGQYQRAIRVPGGETRR